MARHPKTVTLENFLGINNVTPAHKTPTNYLKELVNFDIDEAGNIFRRKGYEMVQEGSFHSLWSDTQGCYAVKDGDLVKIDGCDFSLTALTTSQNLTAPIDFERVDDTLYYSSTETNGRIMQGTEILPWSVERPFGTPFLNHSANGSLSKGGYGVAITYLYASGEEGGSSLPSFIEIPTNSSIVITGLIPPNDPLVEYINIYTTHTNGVRLYYNQTVKVSDLPTNVTISATLNDKQTLRTFNKYPAPLGHLVEWFAGRVYIAEGNTLWYSDPQEYGLWDYQSGYILFDTPITAICPVDGGLWVSDETAIFYLQGKDPAGFKRVEKEPSSIVPGSTVKMHGDLISIENTPVGYKWMVTTSRGIVVLYNDGLIINLSSKNVSLPLANHSASALFEQDGISKYISLLDEKQPSNNTQMADRLSGTIIRNGVALPSDT